MTSGRSVALRIGGVWLVLAGVLAAVAARVTDWYDMTDELRYERLAISIARSHSLVPRVHGIDIRSFAQLYPLLIAPVFAHGLVPHDLELAHVVNGFVMASVCIPAFLLARRVTGSHRAAFVAAFLVVCVPWILYTTMLMTEVAAYPVFMWAMLAIQAATITPSRRNDMLALVAIVIAFFGRTELVSLVLVLPVSIVAYELGRGRGALRRAADAHRTLVAAYIVLCAGALALKATGRFSDVFGVYGSYAQTQTLIPRGLPGSLVEHVATFSLGLGILPFVAGAGWMIANVLRPSQQREPHAFACIAVITAVVVLFQSTIFDLRYNFNVHDRFLVYLAPLFTIGTICAALDHRRPRWSLVAPAALVALGFSFGALPSWTWSDPLGRLLPDSPVSILYDPIVRTSHGLTDARVVLVLATAVLALACALGATLLSRRAFTGLLVGFAVAASVTTTGYVFYRFFAAPGWAGGSLTASETNLDWVDRQVGPNASVTMIPFPDTSDYFIAQQIWRDLEFFNKSIQRDAHTPSNAFAYTGIWFPKLDIGFDPRTGAANVTPTPYVLQTNKETRFAVAGKTVIQNGNEIVVRAVEPWRAAWLTLGLYDDGWTKPGVTARMRIFPAPGQRQPETRYVFLGARAPDDVPSRPFELATNIAHWRGVVTNGDTFTTTIAVCVPAHGFTDLLMRTPDASAIPGDAASAVSLSEPRRGGISLRTLAIADEIGGACRP